MAYKTHIWVNDTVETNGLLIASVTVEQPKHNRFHLWYRLPLKFKGALSKSCDPFVLATLFMAMRGATDIIVHGEVSPSLIRNLEEFQAAWKRWQPRQYTKIEIIAEIEREGLKPTESDLTVAAFSGGVDSSFTVFRHRVGHFGRARRNLEAGVMVHGFDIPLNEPDTFNKAAEKSAKMLASLGLDLIPISPQLSRS